MNGARIANDVKSFLDDKINRLTVFVVVMCVIFGFGFYNINNKINTVNSNVIQCTKKVHFRYFNLTRSLEDIYNVEIDTHTGRIQK